MRVNTTVLMAAVALFSSQGLSTATEEVDNLITPSGYLEERGATLSGLLNPNSDSSAASGNEDNSASPTTEDSTDILQDDSDSNAAYKSNKHVFDIETFGSAARGDDGSKLNALDDVSMEDIANGLIPANSQKPNDSSNADPESNSTKKHPDLWVPTPDSDTVDDFLDWRKDNNDDTSAASEDTSDSSTGSVDQIWPNKDGVMDTVQDDDGSDMAVPKPKESKYDTDFKMGDAADDGAGAYVATKDKNVDDNVNLYPTTASEDSSDSGNLDDKPLKSKTDADGDELETKKSIEDDAYTVPKSKRYPTFDDSITGSDDGMLNSSSDEKDKKLDEILQDADDFSDNGSYSTNPLETKKIHSFDDDSTSVDTGMAAADLTKKPKQKSITPPSALDHEAGSMGKMDMDGLDKSDDKNLKPPSLTDLLKDYGTTAPSESDYSDNSDSSGSVDPTTPAPTPSPTPEEKKPCHVDWWRKMAFWHKEHKCSEARRLRTDLG